MSDSYTAFAPLTYNPQEVERNGYAVAHSGPTEDKLMVGFYRRSVVNPARSRAEGKRVCENQDYVVIQHPGETLNKLDRPVQDGDKNRWPRQWAQYQEGKKQVPDGIPISLLFPDNPAITDMLTGYAIHTVEQLSNLSSTGIDKVGMGCTEWVNKAKRYLEQAQKGVDYHKFNNEMRNKDEQIALLTTQLGELRNIVGRLSTQQPQRIPQNFDAQTSMIDNTMIPPDVNPVEFSNDFQSPDLSGEVMAQPTPKRRGRPPKQKEL